ncbi:hypothetical protein BJ878DRAFT_524540 [Calycina marina]|uniref:Uncharacterized protein n=1 Tax=Calycina marina TaxID=1763456 RepID=A0A9P7YWV9_9HELO|nr:hypothetical protein BJ878DRAFT_524540 [Calycina marina]
MMRAGPRHTRNAFTTKRSGTSGLVKLVYLGITKISTVAAAPLIEYMGIEKKKKEIEGNTEDPSFWLYICIAAVLVLLGGAFAGLTIALMGQDGVFLQVIATSGEKTERKHAQRVYRLLKKGKHWVLVTLLLSNVIVNETLPIILDRSLGGGWPAVLGSTALIVIFGEVIPQSICVRYGLSIGAFMAPAVWLLMLLLAPIAWPTAKLLDNLLGEDEGTVYKKSGLKTLVTLHKTLGSSPTDRLNQDEVTIISAVLDLKDKAVGDIMTPMEDVFTMSSDTILNDDTMNTILSAGYSRIPIYEPGNPQNFVGMLLVKILITYDPEDCKKVSEFALATLPETRPETSCLDIVNFFQEGKSHMVLVSENPGENNGAIGVVTLEDVIEELIGEEIIDESDVYIDVHKAIRRIAPAPKATQRLQTVVGSTENGHARHNSEDQLVDVSEEAPLSIKDIRSPAISTREPTATFLRRASGGSESVAVRGNMTDMREHLKHLGPSNLASRPKTTRYQTVKIKPGLTTGASDTRAVTGTTYQDLVVDGSYHDLSAAAGGEGEGLLKSAGRETSDGVHALQQAYGGTDSFPRFNDITVSGRHTQIDGSEDGSIAPSKNQGSNTDVATKSANASGNLPTVHCGESSDTVGSMLSKTPRKMRGAARSGSIMENIVEANGIRKVVLETTSNSDEDGNDHVNLRHMDGASEFLKDNGDNRERTKRLAKGEEVKRKRRRTRKKKIAKAGEGLAASGSAQGESSREN